MRSTPLAAEPLRLPTGLRAFTRSIGVGARAVFAAPAVLLGRCAFYVFLVVILATFWDKVAAERVPGGLAHALPVGGLALYIAVTEWVTLGTPSVHLRLEDDIRSGLLEGRLLRPKSHLLLRLGDGIGSMLARMLGIGLTAVIVFAATGRHGPPLAALPATMLLGLLGAIVGVLNLTLVGLSSFWLRRTLPIYLINQKGCFLLGGLFAPITLYPDWLERVAALSPFAAQLYWPAAMATTPSADLFVRALASQLAWISILTLAILGVWTLGVRKVVREGGV